MKHPKFHDIILYMLPGSRNCELVKNYLTSNSLEFNEVDVSKDIPAAKKMRDMSGQNHVPVTTIDDRVVIGYHPEVFDMILFDKVSDI